MKKLTAVCSLVLVMFAGVLLTGCGGNGAPQTKDTSAVAGVYYQREGDVSTGAEIPATKFTLNANGTWEVGTGTEKTSHTFTIDGQNISIYFGNGKIMYGTIDADGKMVLNVFELMTWAEHTYFKTAAAA